MCVCGGGGVRYECTVYLQHHSHLRSMSILPAIYFLLKPEKEGLAHPDMGHPIDFLMLPFSDHIPCSPNTHLPQVHILASTQNHSYTCTQSLDC